MSVASLSSRTRGDAADAEPACPSPRGSVGPREISQLDRARVDHGRVDHGRVDHGRALDAFGPLAGVSGYDLQVPLIDGRSVRYANLDYAASAPALDAVIEDQQRVLPYYASVHRGAGYASAVSTALYEQARQTVAEFVGARSEDLTIFTRNTTDALNLLADAVPAEVGVVCLDIEHHANLLPWQGLQATIVPASATLAATLDDLDRVLAETGAGLLAITGASNVTGEVLPLRRLADLAHRHGARLAVDGAQLVPHRRINIAESGVDYLAFSGHKIYAPFGTGVLIGRADWLDAADPYLAGGGAVRKVTVEHTDWATGEARHEGGTPNVLGAAALASACRAIDEIGDDHLRRHEWR
ncbi:MAG TPA: aminotransferase class V-fold PLP-dependent enzyme, partial [Microlunatus sp.]